MDFLNGTFLRQDFFKEPLNVKFSLELFWAINSEFPKDHQTLISIGPSNMEFFKGQFFQYFFFFKDQNALNVHFCQETIFSKIFIKET